MNPPPDTAVAPPGSKAGFWVTLLAALGCFVIFLVVLFLAYIPQRRMAPEVDLAKIPPEEQWKYTPAGRQAHLEDHRGLFPGQPLHTLAGYGRQFHGHLHKRPHFRGHAR